MYVLFYTKTIESIFHLLRSFGWVADLSFALYKNKQPTTAAPATISTDMTILFYSSFFSSNIDMYKTVCRCIYFSFTLFQFLRLLLLLLLILILIFRFDSIPLTFSLLNKYLNAGKINIDKNAQTFGFYFAYAYRFYMPFLWLNQLLHLKKKQTTERSEIEIKTFFFFARKKKCAGWRSYLAQSHHK